MANSRNEFSRFFDDQMIYLKLYFCRLPGLPAILEALGKKRDIVLSKVADIEIPEGHFPFIPVIPKTDVNLKALMRMVMVTSKSGRFSDEFDVRDVVQVPKGPYFMLDVENGKDMLNKSSEVAEPLIKAQGRFGLITEEGIALCVHCGDHGKYHQHLLYKQCVLCTGSRNECGDMVPFIFWNFCGPTLCWRRLGYSHESSGSPSCRCRV